MLNTHEIVDFSTSQPSKPPETVKAGNENRANSVGMVFDVADGNAFSDRYGHPNVSVLAAFGVDPLHVCRLEAGSWDLERAGSENPDCLVRSIHNLPFKDVPGNWDNLTFRFGPRAFLYANAERVVGFADTSLEAERLVTQFNKRYAMEIKAPPPSGGTFHLIKISPRDVECEAVPLASDTILCEEAFRLHYGGRALEWHEGFIRKLQTSHHGLSIFEGTPGTGKTYYLRHLMGELKESHRFYFIPTSTMSVLSSPNFIEFWTDQRRIYSNQKFVVILEDSDAALMTRGCDNREQVSALLNLSDGMLADFLRLHIICTINCTTADIDQALLRPGRLLCHRVFGRLDPSQAAQLAASLGKSLPSVRDYSLAEVFAGSASNEKSGNPRIGFGI